MSGIITIILNGRPVELEQCETGYFNGGTTVAALDGGSISIHVEAVQVLGGPSAPYAKNDNYQPIIDSWATRNDGCAPCLLQIGKAQYFINVEVFAQ